MDPRPLAAPLLAALLPLALAPGARAQEAPTLREATSVRAAGMGGAARGFASSSEALLVNPAGIAATTRFNLDLAATFAPESGHLIGVSAVDSKLNAEESVPLSGGLGYWHYQGGGSGDAQRRGSVLALGLAAPLADWLYFGVAARYLSLSGAVSTSAVTGDAGVILKLSPAVGLAAVGYNLINVHSAEAPRAWGFGLALGRDDGMHLDFDTRIDQDAEGSWKALYQVGAEYLIAQVVEPRVGYADDRLRDTRSLSGGLTLQLGGVALDGFYQKTLSASGWLFGLGLRVLDSPF